MVSNDPSSDKLNRNRVNQSQGEEGQKDHSLWASLKTARGIHVKPSRPGVPASTAEDVCREPAHGADAPGCVSVRGHEFI